MSEVPSNTLIRIEPPLPLEKFKTMAREKEVDLALLTIHNPNEPTESRFQLDPLGQGSAIQQIQFDIVAKVFKEYRIYNCC